eukprot:SM000271S10030  [mRNA]  locus=s271:37004:40064:- [translate_table: standard]
MAMDKASGRPSFAVSFQMPPSSATADVAARAAGLAAGRAGAARALRLPSAPVVGKTWGMAVKPRSAAEALAAMVGQHRHAEPHGADEGAAAASTARRGDWPWSGADRSASCRGSKLQPTGAFYLIPRNEAVCNYSFDVASGKKTEEIMKLDESNSVFTSLERSRWTDEKSVLVTTTHKLNTNHALNTNYNNSPCEGERFTLSTLHKVIPDATFSTSFHTSTLGARTLELELQQEKESEKMSKSLTKNFKTGDYRLQLRSRNSMPCGVTLTNTYVSNLRDQHSCSLEAKTASVNLGTFSHSMKLDSAGSRQLNLKAKKRVCSTLEMEASYSTNLLDVNRLKLEAQWKLGRKEDVLVKLNNNFRGGTQLSFGCSRLEGTQWACHLKRAAADGVSLGVEWRKQLGAAEHYLSLKASAKREGLTAFAEYHLPV